MKPSTRLLAYLEQQGVRYQLLHHPVVYTAQELAAVAGVKGRQQAKVVLLTNGPNLWLAVLPADQRLDFAKLRTATGQALALAPEEKFPERFPDCEPGTVPPFGNLYDVPTLIDRRLADTEWILFAAGSHTDAVRLGTADYLRLARPTLADIVAENP